LNTPTENIICTNCQTEFIGSYCPSCGEKKFDKHDLTIAHFAEETVEGLFHFDNKFFRTIKTLFTSPGQLSLDYVSGRKSRFVKPFQFFLIVNLIYFLLPLSNPFSLPLENYIQYRPFTNYNTVATLNAKLAKEHTTIVNYEPRFKEEMHVNSKEFILVFIPAYALIFGLLFFNKKRTFAEHLVFATHYQAFVLIAFLVIPFIAEIGVGLAGIKYGNEFSQVFDIIFSAVYTLALAAYLFFAFKKFYQAHWVQNLVVALAVALVYFNLLQYYRMFLFYKIMYFA